jgi:hypothetical protein
MCSLQRNFESGAEAVPVAGGLSGGMRFAVGSGAGVLATVSAVDVACALALGVADGVTTASFGCAGADF